MASVSSAFAATGLRLTTERKTIRVGDSVLIQLQIPSDSAKVQSIGISQGGHLVSAGTQNTVNVVNGRIERTNTINYKFSASKPGQYQVGPARVRLSGRIVQSNAVMITVQNGGQGRHLELDVQLSDTTVFEGQPFAEVVTAVYGAELKPVGWDPKAPAAMVDILGQDKSIQKNFSVERESRQFDALLLERWLYGQRAGTYSMGGGSLTFQLPQQANRRRSSPFGGLLGDPFGAFGGGARKQQVQLPKRGLRVLPLPSVPAGLQFIGVVGVVHAAWKPTGERSNQRRGLLTIDGYGAAPAFHVESWTASGWQIYPDKADISYRTDASKKLLIQVNVPLTLVPSQGESQGNPAWFDPQLRQYRAVKLKLPPSIVQSPGGSDNATSIGGRPSELANVTSDHVVVIEDGLPVRILSRPMADIALVTALAILLLSLLPFVRLRSANRSWDDVVKLLETALAADSELAWGACFDQLEMLPETLKRDRKVQAVLAAISAALYAPTFHSPADPVLSIIKGVVE